MVLIKQALAQGKGLNDWLLQRISAVFLSLYLWPLSLYWMWNAAELTQDDWQIFLLHPVMKILGAFAAIGLFIHATIGIWIVSTDYVKPDTLRKRLLAAFYLLIFASSIGLLLLLWRF